MYQLSFYVPVDAADAVKAAVFATGAGAIGEYQQCCWQTLGQGQFLPSLNASPAIGEKGLLSHVQELKVEMVCDKQHLKQAVEALLAAHPYETPAYHFFEIHGLEDL